MESKQLNQFFVLRIKNLAQAMFHYFIFDLKKDNFSGFSTKKFHNGISIDFFVVTYVL